MEYACGGLSLKSTGPLLLLVNMKVPAKKHLNIVHGCSAYIALKCGLYGNLFCGFFLYIYVYIYKKIQFLVHAQGALSKYQLRVGQTV